MPITMRIPLLLAVLAAALIAAGTPSLAETKRLVYDVHHARYGSIGTYTNEVATNGDTTRVKTEARIRVSLLGIVLYRQDAEREEEWKDGRLVSFRSVTTINGREIALNGRAQGDYFVLQSPEGAVVAPASVRLANPWSPAVLDTNMVITPDRGRLESVEVSEMERASVAIEGRDVMTTRYEIHQEGRVRYEIWLDDEGTPVKFRVHNRNGIVTFTLNA